MTSKLVVNTIEADTGISSVSFASSISMNSTAKFHFSAAGIDIGADTNINRPASGTIGFNINSGEKIRIDSSGQLGIGIVSPASPLHAYHATTNTIAQFQSGDAGAGILLKDNTHYTRLESTNGTFKIDVDAGAQIGSEVISFQISNSEKLRIDSDGRILVGHNSARVISTTVNPYLQLEGTTFHQSAISVTRNTDDAYGSYLILGKSRATSNGGNAILQDNDIISEVRFAGSDGNDMVNVAAQIRVEVDGTPQTDQMPGAMIFYTNSGGANATERLRIGSDGMSTFDAGAPNSSNKVIGRFQAESSRKLDIVWHDSGSLMGFDTPGNHSYIFKTNGTERLRIDSSGNVTKPYHPAFKIAILSQNSPNSGVVSENNGFTLKDGSSGDTFRDAFNNGDHFDQATGKFTAPVTGVYYFHFSVMRSSTYGSGSFDLRIKKNTGLMLARSYRANYSTEGNFASMNVTTITSMTAGHYIEFILGGSMSTYEDDSYMLGYLIG